MIDMCVTLGDAAGGKTKPRVQCHFILKNDHFSKTGSGQHIGKAKHCKTGAAAGHALSLAKCSSTNKAQQWKFDAVRKTPLFAPFIYKSHLFTKTGSGQT
eukprot:COSAG06_NODE_23897_length_678_cov_1.765112_1_plen_100_part_00